jgi:hypothetical protein
MAAKEKSTMSTATVTVQLPDPLYARLAERARRANRPVEAEVVSVLESAVVSDDGLPADLAAELAALNSRTDADLWQAARNRLAEEVTRRAERLHHKRQRGGLTAAEAQELAGLVRQSERVMLVRAEAARLLHSRGHDVSGLVAP